MNNHLWKFSILCDDLWMEFENVPDIIGSRETLSGWLSDDVRDYHKILEYIDNVISKKNDEDFIWGNGYKAYVRKDFTEIHFNFEEDVPTVMPCTVPTKLLREIVKAWLDEYEKFREAKVEK